VIELLAVLDTEVSDAAAANGNDRSPLPTRPPGGEESYWQTATGDETGEAEAAQASDPGPVRLSPLEQHFETEQFLAENAEREDVVSLPSGLQYRVLKSGGGSGRSPSATDTVVIKYRGTLPDGREFDRSEGAAEFSLQEVIPGWQEALQQMEEGAEWELYIPPSLAHKGATRRRGALGQQPLIYQVELVSINQSGQAPADE
jgi:FKBP-type peptidyl-prolyl cis-trans isomerase